MHDAINSSVVGPGIEEFLVVHELFPNKLRMLHHLPVKIHHVECSVRPCSRIHGHEPGIGRGQKVPFFFQPSGNKGHAVRDQAVGMHQVVDRLSDEISPLIVGREAAARVDRLAARRSEMIQFGHQPRRPGLRPMRSRTDGIDA